MISDKELQKKLNGIKQNKDSLVIKLLEDLGLKYRILDSEDYNGLRVRVVVKSELKNYAYTDIWYSRFDDGWVSRNYWRE